MHPRARRDAGPAAALRSRMPRRVARTDPPPTRPAAARATPADAPPTTPRRRRAEARRPTTSRRATTRTATSPRRRGRHQRRARPDLPRDRRHPRGQGRARVQDRRLPPGRGRDRARAVRRRRRVRGGRAAADPGRRQGDRATRSPSSRRPAAWRTTSELRAEIPPTLVDLLRIPGVGPKTVRIVWEALGIADLADAQGRRRRRQRLRELKGISASTEERILEGIEKLETAPRRLLIHRAQAASDDLVEQLRGVPGRDPDRPGGLAPPPPRVDRRPRPARRDGGPEDGRRAVHPPRRASTRSSAPGRRRRRSRSCAGRRST